MKILEDKWWITFSLKGYIDIALPVGLYCDVYKFGWIYLVHQHE